MEIPEISNLTRFAFAPTYLPDQDGRPLLVLVVKGSFAIGKGQTLSLAERQIEVMPAGLAWDARPNGSFKYEPDIAFAKCATDVVLVGSASAPRPGTTAMDVELRAGALRKTVRIFGDRRWMKSLTGFRASAPAPFERIELRFERAFGGGEPVGEEALHRHFDVRNPIGVGYTAPGRPVVDGLAMPNLEDPSALISTANDRPAPAGFGFTSPHWQPRAAFAGTYDHAWRTSRMPLLPADFDLRFFSAASAGLTAPGFFKGDEPIQVLGASPGGALSFDLPGVRPPVCRVKRRSCPDEIVETRLDTVVVDTDESLVLLTWRGHLRLKRGPEDVLAIDIAEPAGTGDRLATAASSVSAVR